MTEAFLFGWGLCLFARTMGGAFFGGELLNVAQFQQVNAADLLRSQPPIGDQLLNAALTHADNVGGLFSRYFHQLIPVSDPPDSGVSSVSKA